MAVLPTKQTIPVHFLLVLHAVGCLAEQDTPENEAIKSPRNNQFIIHV